MPDPQRRRPPTGPRPTEPACGGKFRDTSMPAFRTGAPGEHCRCCLGNGAEAAYYPDGHRPVQPPDLLETAAAGHQVLCPDRAPLRSLDRTTPA